MIERILDALSPINPRMLQLVMVLILGAAALEGWVLVLRKPFAEYRHLATTRSSLNATVAASATQQSELNRLKSELNKLDERLAGEVRTPGPEDQLAVGLMTALDRAAARKGIALTSVKPGGRRQVLSFEEIGFDVGAQGRYLLLCQWLLDFERTLGRSATVTDFTMTYLNDKGGQVALTLKLALYRPITSAGAGK